MRRNNDLLVEAAVSGAEAESHNGMGEVAATRAFRIPVIVADRPRISVQGREWSPEEDEYLRANLGRISEKEIGAALGRTALAVELRWKRDLHLPAPGRHHPLWFTLEEVAVGIGVDSHSVVRMINRGLLEVRRLPTEKNLIRVVDREYLLRWILDPMHWVYFRPERVGLFRKLSWRRTGRPDIVFWRNARLQVQEACKNWNDVWLTPHQAQKLAIPGSKMRQRGGLINNAVHWGLIQGVKWGNWRFLRSEVERFAREHVVRKPGWTRTRVIRSIEAFERKFSPARMKEIQAKRYESAFWQAKFKRNDEIRAKRKIGVSMAALAKEYRLTGARICQICSGKRVKKRPRWQAKGRK